MPYIKRTIKCLLIFGLITAFTAAGCAEAKRAKIVEKTKTDSCDLSEMGKNRYFHSKHYKRNIGKSTRKIRHWPKRPYFGFSISTSDKESLTFISNPPELNTEARNCASSRE